MTGHREARVAWETMALVAAVSVWLMLPANPDAHVLVVFAVGLMLVTEAGLRHRDHEPILVVLRPLLLLVGAGLAALVHQHDPAAPWLELGVLVAAPVLIDGLATRIIDALRNVRPGPRTNPTPTLTTRWEPGLWAEAPQIPDPPRRLRLEDFDASPRPERPLPAPVRRPAPAMSDFDDALGLAPAPPAPVPAPAPVPTPLPRVARGSRRRPSLADFDEAPAPKKARTKARNSKVRLEVVAGTPLVVAGKTASLVAYSPVGDELAVAMGNLPDDLDVGLMVAASQAQWVLSATDTPAALAARTGELLRHLPPGSRLGTPDEATVVVAEQSTRPRSVDGGWSVGEHHLAVLCVPSALGERTVPHAAWALRQLSALECRGVARRHDGAWTVAVIVPATSSDDLELPDQLAVAASRWQEIAASAGLRTTVAHPSIASELVLAGALS